MSESQEYASSVVGNLLIDVEKACSQRDLERDVVIEEVLSKLSGDVSGVLAERLVDVYSLEFEFSEYEREQLRQRVVSVDWDGFSSTEYTIRDYVLAAATVVAEDEGRDVFGSMDFEKVVETFDCDVDAVLDLRVAVREGHYVDE